MPEGTDDGLKSITIKPGAGDPDLDAAYLGEMREEPVPRKKGKRRKGRSGQKYVDPFDDCGMNAIAR